MAELVRAARNPHASMGDQHAAFATLVQRFEDMAVAIALRSCGDGESARDICQEAFLAAWRHLPSLREPAAFGAWLKRLVRTHATRTRRRRVGPPDSIVESVAGQAAACDPADLASRDDEAQLIRHAVDRLPERERIAVSLFYFLGEPLRVIARTMAVSTASAGKTLYTARLRLRRSLPRSVAASFLAAKPTPAFTRCVRAGILDEVVGDYSFIRRPEHLVSIRREGDTLVSYAGGQRNVLSSRRADSLAPTEFDGEGRFQRDRNGRISRVVYYEFGRRLGVARKL